MPRISSQPHGDHTSSLSNWAPSLTTPSESTTPTMPHEDGFSMSSSSFGASSLAPASPLARPTASFGSASSTRAGRCPELSASTKRALIELSDPSTVSSLDDFEARIEAIEDIFVANQDPRGAFTSLYRVITNQAVASVKEEKYEDNDWGARLTVDFGQRYLENLHGHLTGGRVDQGWRRYYSLANNPNVSLERVAAMGATIHLVVDLPASIAAVDTLLERKDDFMLFGDILLEVYPQMIAASQSGLGIDMSDLFGLFFLGDVADAVAGNGTSTRFAFQTIRNKAWIFGQWLGDLRVIPAKAEITIAWRTIDGILANLDAAKIL